MYKLTASIIKDIRILTRDKVGLGFMFAMPVLLAIVITTIQNSTFELVNDNKVPLMVCNRDTGAAAKDLVAAIDKIGMFKLAMAPLGTTESQIAEKIHAKESLVAFVIPKNYTQNLQEKAENVASRALKDLGIGDSVKSAASKVDSIRFYYHPVLQPSFRQSVPGLVEAPG